MKERSSAGDPLAFIPSPVLLPWRFDSGGEAVGAAVPPRTVPSSPAGLMRDDSAISQSRRPPPRLHDCPRLARRTAANELAPALFSRTKTARSGANLDAVCWIVALVANRR